MNTTTEETTLAPVVEALHTAYADLSAHVQAVTGKPLPRAIIVVKRDARAWGHITVAGNAWKSESMELDEDYAYGAVAVSMGLGLKSVEQGFHEIMVSGENLSRGGRAVFGTLAHEASHAYNIMAGIRDVDSNGRHNKKFKSTAESLFGLEITKVSESIGWSFTTVPESCRATWWKSIKAIDDAIATVAQHGQTGSSFGGGGGFTFGGGGSAPTGRNKNLLKATCGCGSTLRASQKVLDKGVTCDECGENFTA
jgi:hypothetical protein